MQSDLGAWDGAPVLAYGFEDLTAAEWALVEALGARTEVTVSIPYEPGRPAFSALERTVRDLAGLAAGSIEELPPATDLPAGSLLDTNRARALRRLALDGGPARRLGALPRGLWRARHCGARRAPRSLRSSARARRPSGSASSASRSSAGVRRSRPCSARSESLTRSSSGHGSARRPSAARYSRSSASTGSVAAAPSCSPSSALRSPASSAGPSTTSRAACEGARSWTPLASRRRPRSCAARRSRRSPSSGLTSIRCRSACAAPAARSQRLGARRLRLPPTTRAGTRARTRPSRETLDGLESFERREGTPLVTRGGGGRARARDGATDGTGRGRPRGGARLCAGTDADVRRRRPARPRGGRPPAAGSPVTAARRRRAPRARIATGTDGLRGARPLSLLHRVHACDPAARARARGGERRRRTARAQPVLGRRARAFRPGRRRPRDAPAPAVQPHLAARSRAERAGAPPRRRPSRSRRRRRRRGAGRRQRLVTSVRPRACRVRPAHSAARTPPSSSRCRTGRPSPRPSSSASPTARPRGSSSA